MPSDIMRYAALGHWAESIIIVVVIVVRIRVERTLLSLGLRHDACHGHN